MMRRRTAWPLMIIVTANMRPQVLLQLVLALAVRAASRTLRQHLRGEEALAVALPLLLLALLPLASRDGKPAALRLGDTAGLRQAQALLRTRTPLMKLWMTTKTALA